MVGLLAPEPLESLAWAAEAGVPRAYADLLALLSDDIEAVCVEMPPPGSDIVARRAAEIGLHVLLAGPATAEAETLRAVADLAEEADLAHVVALDGRAWPAATHVAATVPSLGRLTQMTVVGAPTGPTGRVKIIDLTMRWCGESGRIVVQGHRVRRQDDTGVHDLLMPTPPTARPGLMEATYDVVRATELDDARLVRGATFHDLLTANRLIAAARTSHQRGGWIEL